MSRLLPLLPLLGLVTLAANMPPCAHDEYETLHHCCRLCPAGHYVSRDCNEEKQTECERCPSGTFLPFANQETRCWPCSHCRQDQEVAAECSPSRDRRCQCRQGRFFCDSADCVEQCYRCRSCAGGRVLQKCNSTMDTVCGEGGPSSSGNKLSVITPLAIIVLAVILTVIACRKRGSSRAPSEPSHRSSLSDQDQLPEDPELHKPALIEEMEVLVPSDGPSALAPGNLNSFNDPGEALTIQGSGPLLSLSQKMPSLCALEQFGAQ